MRPALPQLAFSSLSKLSVMRMIKGLLEKTNKAPVVMAATQVLIMLLIMLLLRR